MVSHGEAAEVNRRRRMAAAALLRAGTAPATEPTEAPLTSEQHWMVETAEVWPEAAALASVAAVAVPAATRDRLPGAIGRALDEVDAPALRLTWSLGVPAQTRGRIGSGAAISVEGASTVDEVTQDLQRPFDLTGGPTVRTAVVTAGADTTVLVSASRIFVDRWSCLALAARIGQLARDPGARTRAPLRSFLRHCATHARSAHAADLGAAAASELDLTSPSLLPIDGTRTAMPDVSAHWQRESVSWDVVRAATPAGCSTRSTMIATVAAGIARLGGSDLIRIGITERTAGADRHHVIGCGTTTTIRTCAVPARRTFHDLVAGCDRWPPSRAHLRDVLYSADDSPTHEPAVTVGMEFVGSVESPAAGGTPRLLASRTPLYELTVVCHEASDHLELICEYRPDLFTADTVRSLLSCWTGLLADAARRPDSPIELMSLPGLVRHLPPAVTVPAARPVSTARVQFADSAVHEIAACLDELAGAGIGAMSTVAIEASESAGFVGRLLAALALQADVAVLDPADPVTWRRHVADRVGADVVVHSGGVLERTGRAPEGRRRPEPAGLLVVQSALRRGGVVRVPLASLLAAAGAAASAWALRPGDRLAHSASWASEDAAIALLCAGHSGATLVRLPATLSGPALLDALDAGSIDVADLDETQLTTFPSTLLPPDMRLGTRVPEGTSEARTPAGPPLIRRWWTPAAPDVILVGDGRLRLVGAAGAARIATVSCLPLPAGRSGRLWVAVADGARYQDDPRATAEKFRPDPDGSGGRLLDTGVRARADRDGTLVVDGLEAGRACRSGRSMTVDDLRSVLAGQDVRGYADVVPDEWGVGRGTFLVVGAAAGRDAGELSGTLARRLPGTLVPRVVVGPERVETVDRPTALRLAERALSRRPELAPPRPGLEAELAEQVIAPLLGVADPGRTETVFGLGASSLQVLRMITSVNEIYGVDVALATFLQEPHLAGLAAAIERARTEHATHARELAEVLSLVDTMDDGQ
jgi:hypothetical protein